MNRSRLSIRLLSLGLQVALFAGAFLFAPTASAQKAFPTPEAAADALVDGITHQDDAAIKSIIGAHFGRYIPLDSVASEDRTRFLEAWAASHKIVPSGEDKAYLEAGTHGWTLPIPIVRTAAGWRFDTKGAAEEMRTRRIGRNELAAIQAALAYTDAQDEYASRDWDGDGVKAFASRILSTPGKQDGLYWASLPGEGESPLGPQFADATPGQPYHGYRFKILAGQGKDAPGGARGYLSNGRMTEGFALVAWPDRYGDTGIMTFIVNRDGVVYQKDLGPKSAALAKAMTAYNPDPSWEKVPLQQ